MPVTREKGSHAACLHLSWTGVTPQDDRGGGLRFSAPQNMLLDKDQEKKIFNFSSEHLRHKLGKRQAVRAVKAVHAHNHHDAMHQYVMTNLSLRDTIRRRQEPPDIGWKESRLTAKERQSGIKDQLCQEEGDTALSSLPCPHSMLFISRSAEDIG